MRYTTRLTLFSLSGCLLFGLAIAGCGSDSAIPETPKDLAMPDLVTLPDLSVPADLTVPKDFSVPPDLTPRPDYSAVTCGNATCAKGQTCCITVDAQNQMVSESCQASCDKDAGAVPLACDGPDQCGGNPCCVDIAFANNMVQTNGAMCTKNMGSCNFNFMGMGVTTRLCHQDVDCAGQQVLGMPLKCCSAQAQPIHFCAIPINMGGIAVTCP